MLQIITLAGKNEYTDNSRPLRFQIFRKWTQLAKTRDNKTMNRSGGFLRFWDGESNPATW